MGVIWSKMTGQRSSRVINRSSSKNSSSGSQARSMPIKQPTRNLRSKITGIITKTGRKSSFGFNNNQRVFYYQQKNYHSKFTKVTKTVFGF